MESTKADNYIGKHIKEISYYSSLLKIIIAFKQSNSNVMSVDNTFESKLHEQ